VECGLVDEEFLALGVSDAGELFRGSEWYATVVELEGELFGPIEDLEAIFDPVSGAVEELCSAVGALRMVLDYGVYGKRFLEG